MTTKELAISYAITTGIFFAIDMVWLGIIAQPFYKKYLGDLLTKDVIWWAAILFYLLFIVGILLFVLLPALKQSSWQYAATYGALFGFFTYATYDLTNYATLKNWPWQVVVVDMLWGTILTATVATISYFIISKIS